MRWLCSHGSNSFPMSLLLMSILFISQLNLLRVESSEIGSISPLEGEGDSCIISASKLKELPESALVSASVSRCEWTEIEENEIREVFVAEAKSSVRAMLRNELSEFLNSIVSQKKILGELSRQLDIQHDHISQLLDSSQDLSNVLLEKTIQGFSFRDNANRKDEFGSIQALDTPWQRCFHQSANFKLNAMITFIQILESKSSSHRFVVLGDTKGILHIQKVPSSQSDSFTTYGVLKTASLEVPSPSSSPVTAILGVRNTRNKTWIVSGHKDGSVFLFSMEEKRNLRSLNGESVAEDLSDDMPLISLQTPLSLPTDQTNVSSILGLETFKSGSNRYFVVWDASCRIQIFRSNGSLYGSLKVPEAPLTFLRTRQSGRLFFLTQSLAGSLNVRSLELTMKPCRNLNGSRVVSYAFESLGRSRAYGVTDRRELVDVALTGHSAKKFGCDVRVKRVVAVDFPVNLVKIKGYLALVNWETISLFNVSLKNTASSKSSIRPVVDLPMQALLSHGYRSPSPAPVTTSNREHTVAIAFPDGEVRVIESVLPGPVSRRMAPQLSFPIVALGVLFVSIWLLLRWRRDARSAAKLSHGGAGEVSPPLQKATRLYFTNSSNEGGKFNPRIYEGSSAAQEDKNLPLFLQYQSYGREKRNSDSSPLSDGNGSVGPGSTYPPSRRLVRQLD